MIFMLTYMFIIFGLITASLAGLMPYNTQYMIPDYFRFILFFVGCIITFVGIIMLHGRANKTGAIHLLEFGRPDNILWFYVYRDGTMKITPSMREVEGTLYSKELDALITDFKSYRCFDHSVRFVPEGLGHSADLDMVLYATLLKTKKGFANLREARRGKRGAKPGKEILSDEMVSLNPRRDFGGTRWEG